MAETQGKTPNIKLREGAEPITISGLAHVGASLEPLRFPTLIRQQNGWCSKEAKRIVACYGDRYELINGGGCNCNG
jgi:hypothetical protein